MAAFRIAILDCDPLSPKICEKYESYGGVATAWLEAGARELGLARKDLDITIWDVLEKKEYPRVEDVESVLILGSRYSAFDNVPWIQQLLEFIKHLMTQGTVKIMGLCFGHQIVARALGAEIVKSSLGWEVSVQTMHLSTKGKELFGKEEIDLHQMHKDVVCCCPRGVESLGWSPMCEVQGMHVPDKIITVQGHPEFDEELMLELLDARYDLGIEDDRIFEEAVSRAGKSHDGVLVAQIFIRFLKGEP